MPIQLDVAYRDSRLRLTQLIADLPDPKSIPVPACPGWSAHDVASHLVAVIEDVAAGRLTGPPTDEQSAQQVGRRASVPTAQVLDDWLGLAPQIEGLLATTAVWPAVMDVLSHEHDVRGAIGLPGDRQSVDISACAHVLMAGLTTDPGICVRLDGQVVKGEVDNDLVLTTTAWEAFRFRLGRRSRAQLAQMDWSADPAQVLGQLTIFGPSPLDISE